MAAAMKMLLLFLQLFSFFLLAYSDHDRFGEPHLRPTTPEPPPSTTTPEPSTLAPSTPQSNTDGPTTEPMKPPTCVPCPPAPTNNCNNGKQEPLKSLSTSTKPSDAKEMFTSFKLFAAVFIAFFGYIY